jgi:hypothetical protein
MSRTLQTSTVYFSRVSYLFECNANDTYVLRMTHFVTSGLSYWSIGLKKPPQRRCSSSVMCLVVRRHCCRSGLSSVFLGPHHKKVLPTAGRLEPSSRRVVVVHGTLFRKSQLAPFASTPQALRPARLCDSPSSAHSLFVVRLLVRVSCLRLFSFDLPDISVVVDGARRS